MGLGNKHRCKGCEHSIWLFEGAKDCTKKNEVHYNEELKWYGVDCKPVKDYEVKGSLTGSLIPLKGSDIVKFIQDNNLTETELWSIDCQLPIIKLSYCDGNKAIFLDANQYQTIKLCNNRIRCMECSGRDTHYNEERCLKGKVLYEDDCKESDTERICKRPKLDNVELS